MCISTQALVSGLLLRIERDAHRATAEDLRAILALRYPRATLRSRLLERAATQPACEQDLFAHALAVLDGLDAP